MLKFLGMIALFLGLGQITAAQDTAEWQIYAGGSFGHEDVSPPFAVSTLNKVSAWGYNLGVEQYVNSWIGGVAEVGDYYRKPTVDLASVGFPGVKEQVRTHGFYLLFGPQLRHNFGKFTPFARATLGYSRAIFKDQAGFISSDQNSYATGLGGGIDVRVHEHISIRVIEADYVLSHFRADRQDNWKVSAGVVFSWGHR
jgi:hypothetical protein